MSNIYLLENGTPYIKKRTENGWTLDFVFNREYQDWNGGLTFYYWGISGETIDYNYADNNLSFQFTPDGRICWKAIHFYPKNILLDTTNIYQLYSGQTNVLCSGGTSNDFNITIVFKRYKSLYECDLDNKGGLNDLVTGLTVSNDLDFQNWLSGDTLTYTAVETLNKKWYKERNDRLGTLKIYLNGNPIYKLENFEEIIPSQRASTNPLVQAWGQGTDGIQEVHSGSTLFNMKNIEYYEEPLDAIAVKNHYNNNIKTMFSITECNEPCNDNLGGEIYNQPTPTPTPTSNTISSCSIFALSGTDNRNFSIYNPNTNLLSYLTTLQLDCNPLSFAMSDGKMFLIDGCKNYYQYDYSTQPFSLSFVNKFQIFAGYSSAGIAFKDSNTLFVTRVEGYSPNLISHIHTYDLTTQNLSLYLSITGDNALIQAIAYNTGTTQMVVSYIRDGQTSGKVQLYSGTTLQSEINLQTSIPSGFYWDGTNLIGTSGISQMLDFTNHSSTMVTAGIPSADVAQEASCYNFTNLVPSIPTPTPTPTPTQSITPSITPSSVTPTPSHTNTTPTPTPTSTPSISSPGYWYFYYSNEGPLSVSNPIGNSNAIFLTNSFHQVFDPNFINGTKQIYFDVKDSNGNDYSTEFLHLLLKGGTLTVTQGSNSAIFYASSGAEFNFNPSSGGINGYLYIDSANGVVQTQTCSKFNARDPITLTFS
jgi:hypothetical protein